MNDTELIVAWEHEERQSLVGWDFSYLDERKRDEPPPWSYATRATELMRTARSALDIDTGGGEWLLRLRPNWPSRLAATESYPPNFRLATERLSPFGVHVVDVAADETVALPFDDDHFDLVLNRHGGLNIPEIARVLTPEGVFLTQQVHGQTLHELLARFGALPQWPDATPARYLPLIAHAGLILVEMREHWGSMTFTDVGAIVYYLHAIPWLVPGFSVKTHTQPLLELQAQVARGEPLRFTTGSYLIEARKPAG
jgi:SAM-dependent methyltransferase